MKTDIKEVLRRESEYREFERRRSFLSKKIHEFFQLEKQGDKNAAKSREDILESKEWKTLSEIASFGPTYDLPIEDIDDPDFRFPWRSKPLDSEFIRSTHTDIGKRVKLRNLNDKYGIFECISYDYGDFYYKVLLDESGKYIYETGCAGIDVYEFIDRGNILGKTIEYISELDDIVILYFTDSTWTGVAPNKIKKE